MKSNKPPGLEYRRFFILCDVIVIELRINIIYNYIKDVYFEGGINMKRKFVFKIAAVILLAVTAVFFLNKDYFSKLYVSKVTGVTDSDDLEIIVGTAAEYDLSVIEISTAYKNLSMVFNSEIFSSGIQDREKEIITLASKGLSETEIRDYAKEKLLTSGFSEQKLKSLANMGWSPILVYTMTDEYIQQIFDSVQQSNAPGGARRMLIYERLTADIFDQYKDGDIKYNEFYSQPPQDFIFPEIIRWDKYSFQQDEMGYFFVAIPSEDERYVMTVSIDDTVYQNIDGTVIDNPPFIRHVNFYENNQ